MVSVTEELILKFCLIFISINLNLNSHMWLMTAVLHSKVLEVGLSTKFIIVELKKKELKCMLNLK